MRASESGHAKPHAVVLRVLCEYGLRVRHRRVLSEVRAIARELPDGRPSFLRNPSRNDAAVPGAREFSVRRDVVEVGDVAYLSGLRVHELTQITASLESAYMALTEDELEYQGAAL